MNVISSVDRGIGDPWTNCMSTIRIARWKRLTCAYRTSYFMRIADVSTIPGRFEVFAIASIRARRRRDRRAQGRVTATSVGGEISPKPIQGNDVSHLLSGHFGATAKFLRGRVEPGNNAIRAKDAFVASRQDRKLIVIGSFQDLLLHLRLFYA